MSHDEYAASGARTDRSQLVRRRELLAAASAAGPIGIAGCLGGYSDSDASTEGGGSATDDGSPSGPRNDSDLGGGTAADAGGPPGDGEWTTTFESTFSDGPRDRLTWSFGAGYDLDCPQLECWRPDNVWVDQDAERLVIETAAEQTGDHDYTSGAVCTRSTFEQQFGYFEAKSRPPAQPGALPAFWAWWNADDWTYRREIDVYEIPGADGSRALHNVHTDCQPREQGAAPTVWRGGEAAVDPPADDAFHVWGVEWTPTSIGFYVDGEETTRVEGRAVEECFAGEPLWLVLSTHVNDEFGDPTEAEYPYTHEFEWVRAWQREDWA